MVIKEPSGYDQLAADDLASAMGRVQTQIKWCLTCLVLFNQIDLADPDFYNGVSQELDLLQQYWVKLRKARNRLLGEDAIAF